MAALVVRFRVRLPKFWMLVLRLSCWAASFSAKRIERGATLEVIEDG